MSDGKPVGGSRKIATGAASNVPRSRAVMPEITGALTPATVVCPRSVPLGSSAAMVTVIGTRVLTLQANEGGIGVEQQRIVAELVHLYRAGERAASGIQQRRCRTRMDAKNSLSVPHRLPSCSLKLPAIGFPASSGLLSM